ncbi:MAG: hypothetical protein UR90_C0019G0005 [Parcubacteria group bacterium GW2011_GWC1_35_8]|uniref:Uncharacterized protein n=2 Tax=Candidatus Nomuraibacteriota TaxID=1752729 RepID=A0A1F6YS77_9BACT|nr:MAG: hypothetical protein UR90_C0019G0005 [Parcubacteria group bacterium GW2011_GWC1_35_8]KKP89402.1 MAG: hypothetical protein UR91_C0003G0023 [Candidatus Nomurabacteria bacterium GW2011_GWC2_35_8]OGJ04913.1 MAG: hypothetical protein A2238_02135 [Candidatus Nomurabacteria bacterium RIFOXYA2_FULL_35_9]OGJ09241.1 MAG: hypothetical protein A2456_00785 [Candidatus Nomurabacteria bacterium RIFOXYC2_FULL_36_19]OGJ14246.1 MAG: hypothetical protein A2554_01820 [Candidatus Nomurabacteria bacterium RI
MKNLSMNVKGGIIGLVLFCLVFVILSLQNTGKVSISDAFFCSGAEGGYCLINYGLVLLFIFFGSFIGWLYGKIKNRNKI